MNIRPHPLNYLCTGAMGQASSHALGLALGAPNEKIVVLDGDGSLLMNLGTLVTIANCAPHNMIHFVIRNGMYEVNGEVPIPGNDQLKFDKLATAAGYPHVYSFDDSDKFSLAVDTILNLKGPVFVELNVVPGELYPRDYKVIHSENSRSTFRQALHERLFDH